MHAAQPPIPGSLLLLLLLVNAAVLLHLPTEFGWLSVHRCCHRGGHCAAVLVPCCPDFLPAGWALLMLSLGWAFTVSLVLL